MIHSQEKIYMNFWGMFWWPIVGIFAANFAIIVNLSSSSSFADGAAVQQQLEQLDGQQIVKLRDKICVANSLRKVAKQFDAYCTAQQQKMAKFYVESANLSTINGCSCANESCTCCADLDIHFRLHHVQESICLNFAYLAKLVAIQVAIVVDGHDVFNITVSATNPPPLCVPFVVGELCFELYNLKVSQNLFSGCALFELLLLHQEVIHEKFGCFKIPVPIHEAIEYY